MFCQKCGTQLPDGSAFCVSCGSSLGPVTGYASAPGQPSAFGSYMSKVWKYIEGFFKSPSKNVQALASEKSPVWITIEAVKYFVCFIAILLFTLAAEQDWVGADSLRQILMFSLLFDNFGMKLLFSLIIFGGTFGVHMLMTWLCAVQITKLQVPMTVILNICAISSLLMIPVMLIAILFSFVWYPLALIILIVGGVLCGVMYTESIRASGIFGSETVWKNALVLCVTIAVFSLLMYWPLAVLP